MNLVCTHEDFREIRRWEVKCKLDLYFSHSAGGLFSVCLGFLSGFAERVSLHLICMANMVVLLFM